jgi:very-short-patch-repair endonuclease
MRNEIDRPDLAVGRIAGRQHGVVTSAQLIDAGLSRSAIARRLRGGRIYAVHRGVYAVGHPALSRHGRWMAAVLACGDGAFLSHGSAARLWQMLPAAGDAEGEIHVSVRSRAGRAKRKGIRLHRPSSLSSPSAIGKRLTTLRNGIPVTTPARTLRDLERIGPDETYGEAIRQASILGYELGAIEVDRTRSELEAAFLRLCRRACLPEPEINVRVGRFLVDFLWRRQLLVVETDGYRFHRGRAAFVGDRARDLDLRVLGYDVLRFAHEQVVGSEEETRRLADHLRERLGRR